MSNTASMTQKQTQRSRSGKYLTFSLGQEQFGLEILKVREIIGYIDVTSVPQTPFYIKGVINLRGQVIPVVDLRLKFGLEEKEITEQTCIIVVEIAGTKDSFLTGLMVDNVSEVLDITSEEIEDPPRFGTDLESSFLLGMGKIGDRVKMLLDIDQVIGDEVSSAVL